MISLYFVTIITQTLSLQLKWKVLKHKKQQITEQLLSLKHQKMNLILKMYFPISK